MKNSENKMILFRDSRKGYDKEDVNRYIEEMNIRFASTEAALNGKLKQLEELTARGAAEEESLRALEAKIAALEEENALLREKAAENESAAEAENAVSEPERPALSYDEASRRLGDILLKANLDADRIVADAEAEAEKQLAGAEKRADDIRLDAAVTARLMTDRVKQRLSEVTEEYLKKLSDLSAASAGEYRKLCDDLSEKLMGVRIRTEQELNNSGRQA